MCGVAGLMVGVLLAASTSAYAQDEYSSSISNWRAERIASLKKPDGWFSYVGSGLVNPGTSKVGSAASNAIVLATGPAYLGDLVLANDGTLSFHVNESVAADVRVDDQPVNGKTLLLTNADGATPTRVQFGKQWFYVVTSGDTIGWRLRDPESPALAAFTGVDSFPIDPEWRIEATWQPFDPPRQIELVTIINSLQKAEVPGKATFERDGRRYELQPVSEDDGRLFFVFADKTSGKETYGAARFLYADPATDGKVVLDFNKAYNPPCALSPHVVCPTAPAHNRLGMRVTAGELTYSPKK
ncbi:MAG: DUF1684 domain-containing protein [Dokdonella sp.]